MNKLVLLTGANGFVGKQIFMGLVDANVKVRLVLRNSQNLNTQLKFAEKVIKTNDLFSENNEWWASTLEDVDIVVHAAWFVEPKTYLNSDENINCLIGSLEMAKGIVLSNVKRFVGIGTCFEYDLSSNKPLTIDHLTRPSSLYATTKNALYLSLSELFKKHNIQFSWGRLFYLFGEGENENRFTPYLHKSLSKGLEVKLKEPNNIRDFIDVKDAAKIIIENVLSNKEGPFNICSGVGITIKQYAENIAKKFDAINLIKEDSEGINISPNTIVGIK
jgi:dTDP-6-deoxy-L-talose 4-dehydrogenase (NAD+)